MASQTKKLQVDVLSKLLTTSKHFALIQFGNTSHKALENLRKELKKGDAKLRVIKLSLFEKAIKKLVKQQADFKELTKKVFPLKENAALLTLGEDYLQGLNIFAKTTKDEKNLTFKFGLLEKKLYPAEELTKIALLPGKDQLMAMLLASLKSPQAKLVWSLKYNVTKLTYVLKGKEKQQ